VLRVKGSGITQLMGKVSGYTFGAPQDSSAPLATPKYHTADGQSDPTAQLDPSMLISPGNSTYCESGY